MWRFSCLQIPPGSLLYSPCLRLFERMGHSANNFSFCLKRLYFSEQVKEHSAGERRVRRVLTHSATPTCRAPPRAKSFTRMALLFKPTGELHGLLTVARSPSSTLGFALGAVLSPGSHRRVTACAPHCDVLRSSVTARTAPGLCPLTPPCPQPGTTPSFPPPPQGWPLRLSRVRITHTILSYRPRHRAVTSKFPPCFL